MNIILMWLTNLVSMIVGVDRTGEYLPACNNEPTTKFKVPTSF